MSVDLPSREPDAPESDAEPELAEEFARFLHHAATERGDASRSLREWLELAEAWRIAQALRESGGNRSAAARALGIGRRTLYAKMERLGIGPIWSVLDRPHDR